MHITRWTLALACALGCTEEARDDIEEAIASDVAVSLDEYRITLDKSSAPAGPITFHVKNDGEERHELVIVETDLAPDALPTKGDGSFDEEGSGVELVDEAEDIAPGDTAELTATLLPGKYVLLCNRVEVEEESEHPNAVTVEDGEVESHYHEGMRIAFQVR